MESELLKIAQDLDCRRTVSGDVVLLQRRGKGRPSMARASTTWGSGIECVNLKTMVVNLTDSRGGGCRVCLWCPQAYAAFHAAFSLRDDAPLLVFRPNQYTSPPHCSVGESGLSLSSQSCKCSVESLQLSDHVSMH
eukprot:6102886-Pleurochrysis_carterae.AAC.3